MCDADVAINAGHVVFFCFDMGFLGTCSLCTNNHGLKFVAISAFSGIGVFHGLPDMFCQGCSLCQEFFTGINGPNDFVIQFVNGTDFTDKFMNPIFGNMAIWAACPNTAFVCKMNGGFVFWVDVIFHLVTGNTKFFGVGQFHAEIESTPKENTGNEDENNGG